MSNLQAITQYYKFQDLTGDEIQDLIGKYPILFSDLKNYKSIDDVLGKEGYAIILYQTSSRTNGHYVAITRNDKGKIRYFDPYGIQGPLKEVQYTPYDQALPNYLQNLLNGVDYEANTTDYESWKKVADCGRWSALACKFRNLSLQQINGLFQNVGFLSDKDNCAVILTLLALSDISKFFSR